MKEFICQQCGKCCREVTINIAASDIRRWLHERRTDILREISFINNYPRKGTGGFYIAATAKAPKEPCPFLVDNLCGIHETKPKACEDFPHGHSVWRTCPAWEAIDFRVDKRKHARAVKTQFRDFKDAHENRHHFLKKLIETRRGQYG